MSSAAVLVIGSINQDAVARVQHFPAPGETIIAAEAFTGLGGKGANQAVAASRAGARVIMAGAVGSDAVGAELLAKISDFEVDTSAVQIVDGLTGVAYINIDDSGENTIVVYSGANHRYSFDPKQKFATDVALVLMQGELKAEVVAQASSFAVAANAKFVLNLAPFISLDETLLSSADLLIVNELEARMLARQLHITGEIADAGLAAAISEKLSTAVAVTLGADGVAYCENGVAYLQAAAKPERIVDTTGAGDAFVGALVAAMVAGKTFADSVRMGVAAGSLAIENLGTTGAYPSRERLESRFAETKEPQQC